MNVLLAYYNLLDDWEDEKNYAAFTAAKALKKSVTRIEASYPRQTKAVQDYLEKLHACEKRKQSRPRSCGGLYRRGDGGDLYSGGGHLER